MKTKLIYAYIKDKKVKYVGQTDCLERRRKQHEVYEAFDERRIEYNYPLSRAIRKYGIDSFSVIVLEDNIPEEKIFEREEYWIKYYDTYLKGYNQNKGGKGNNKYFKFSDELIELAKEKIKQGVPFQDISDLTGISIVHLSEINQGKRRASTNETYPLWSKTSGRKFDEKQVLKIIDLLANTKTSQQEIAITYGVSQRTISNINLGKRYKQENLNYPIRK